jgi:hypothetical protein
LATLIVRQNLLLSDLAKIWIEMLLVGLGIRLQFNFELGRHESWVQLNFLTSAGNIILTNSGCKAAEFTKTRKYGLFSCMQHRRGSQVSTFGPLYLSLFFGQHPSHLGPERGAMRTSAWVKSMIVTNNDSTSNFYRLAVDFISREPSETSLSGC